MSKRTLDGFFTLATKRTKISPPPTTRNHNSTAQKSEETSKTDTTEDGQTSTPDTDTAPIFSHHKTYPHPIAHLPVSLIESLTTLITTSEGASITDQPHLNLLHFQPFIPRPLATELFTFLRSSLPFYRVRYTITRYGKETLINTPRYTTVFGLDETSLFDPPECPTSPSSSTPSTRIIDAVTKQPVKPSKYRCQPRPIPHSLTILKSITEAVTNETYNFVLVNYYATGADSISFHSDDERFLGKDPAIASLSLGAKRDFLMKHKPPSPPAAAGATAAAAAGDGKTFPGTKPLKFELNSGDMILMRGETQSNWLHSIPKRTGKNSEAGQGRINITFRKAMVPGGTENYYRYNVGEGGVYRWDSGKGEMREWKGS
ncbi:Alpha-ketoglutarate-dependent dioxygenase-like protein [Cyphellophora attinorum]|uniref:Alpha-ketoglutarate-dependent dioxygenase-like protein n=1 Tax=Cyphellophora attinorum TaxID=1664694 RepID=A0A0N1HAP4_9EURO|nr:Alpha-ketoglutarate-dependent dioxygenase-like protein [Phialophora attinorum]KPI45093.1 Alpha-ketoglutarate-dependent dioxygenase-like protein [Phialophora attinorum]